MKLSRRSFISKYAIGTAAIASIPGITLANESGRKKKKNRFNHINEGDIILFQGDSITDAGRERIRQRPNSPNSFGTGYALLAASRLLNELPSRNLKIYNRGISGNKVFQLDDRWQKDCIDLKPNHLSILIGVNDYWHSRSGNYRGTVEKYEEDYRKLLDKTMEALPGINLIICEPFYLISTKNVDETWIKPMQEYQKAARRICREFNGTWVPFQRIFDRALKQAPANHWLSDGVHPTMAGAQLMADEILKAFE